MAGGTPVIPQTNAPISDGKGIVTLVWRSFLELMGTYIASLTTAINAVPGVNVFTVATQPSLTAGDAGYIALVTDTNHLLRWSGTAWQWFGGDASGKFEDFAVAASSTEYALCDGSATTLLTLGATLTLTAFTTPNLTGTPAYRKSAAAYTGTINAKAGSTGTGTTGTGSTGTGTTGTDGSHNHTGATGSHVHTGTSDANGPTNQNVSSAVGVLVAGAGHTHTFTTDGATAAISADGNHSHTVPALSVPGLSVPALTVGSIEMANLGVLLYVRR